MTPEVRDILVSLLRKSESGKVKWLDSRSAGMTTVLQEDFTVLMPNSAINVFRGPRRRVRVNILDGEGNVVVYVISGENAEDDELLEALLLSAKQKALGFDKTIQDIKKLLSSDETIGETEPRQFVEEDDDSRF